MTTTTTTKPRTTTLGSAARRVLSTSAAATIAAVGLVAVSAPAYAEPVTGGLKVWVCKYVGTPGEDERLQTGNNPISVSANSADKPKDDKVFVGDQFADAQGRSVIVQIGGEDPGVDSCSPTPPPVPPNGKPTPGDGAPDTGGESGDVPVGLIGGGALLVGAGLVAAEAQRRRRAAARL